MKAILSITKPNKREKRVKTHPALDDVELTHELAAEAADILGLEQLECFENEGGHIDGHEDAPADIRPADHELTPEEEMVAANLLSPREQLNNFEKDLEAHDSGNQPA